MKSSAAPATVPGPVRKGEGAEEPAPAPKPAPRSHVPDYLGILLAANAEFENACETVAAHQAKHLEIVAGLKTLRKYSADAGAMLKPFLEKYGEKPPQDPGALRSALFRLQPGEFGVVRDFHDLYLMAQNAFIAATIMHHAAEGLHDAGFLKTTTVIVEHAKTQAQWAKTHLQHQTSHALVVPS